MQGSRVVAYFLGFVLLTVGVAGCPLLEDSGDENNGGTQTGDGGADTEGGIAYYHDSATGGYHDSDSFDGSDTAAVDTSPLDLAAERIESTTGVLRGFACHGDRVAWGVFGDTGNEVHVWTAGGGISTEPADIAGFGNQILVMSDQVIAWNNRDIDGDPATSETLPRVDGTNVVYQLYPEDPLLSPELRVGPLGSAGQSLGEFWDGSYDISGDRVAAAFSADSITVRSLSGQADIEVPTNSAARVVRISGDIVVWYELKNFGKDSWIGAYDLATDSSYVVAGDVPETPLDLDVDGGYVAYGRTDFVDGQPVGTVFVWDVSTHATREVTSVSGTDRLWGVCIGGGRIAWLVGNEPYADPAQNTWEIYTALLP